MRQLKATHTIHLDTRLMRSSIATAFESSPPDILITQDEHGRFLVSRSSLRVAILKADSRPLPPLSYVLSGQDIKDLVSGAPIVALRLTGPPGPQPADTQVEIAMDGLGRHTERPARHLLTRAASQWDWRQFLARNAWSSDTQGHYSSHAIEACRRVYETLMREPGEASLWLEPVGKQGCIRIYCKQALLAPAICFTAPAQEAMQRRPPLDWLPMAESRRQVNMAPAYCPSRTLH